MINQHLDDYLRLWLGLGCFILEQGQKRRGVWGAFGIAGFGRYGICRRGRLRLFSFHFRREPLLIAG